MMIERFRCIQGSQTALTIQLPHGHLAPQVSVATLLANLSSSPSPGGDSIMDPADSLRDVTAISGLLSYAPEPANGEELTNLLALKVGSYLGVLLPSAPLVTQTRAKDD